jgi:hypothetical protein
MGLFNRLFGKMHPESSKTTASAKKGTPEVDLWAELERSTMNLEDFRGRVMELIWKEDHTGLKQLCHDQIVMTPIFIEKAIEEIQPGNKWNDVLWLMSQRLIKAGNWPHYLPELEEKRHLVTNPDGGKKVMESFMVVTKHPIDKNQLKYPATLLQLLNGDMTGINHEDDATIDRMFADWVILGPGFCRKYLADIDFPYGDRAILRVPLGSPPKLEQFEGKVLRGKARLVPLVLDKFEAILDKYKNGEIREASEEERNLFYSLIDFEIAGRPVYVVESKEGRLLIYLQEKDRIHWIESLDVWRSEKPKKSMDTLDRSILDALRNDFNVD